LSLAASGDLGQILYYSRRYDEGIDQYHRTLELEPNYYRQYLWLGWAHQQKGLYDEAIALFRNAQQLSPDNTEALASLGCAYALAGKREEARVVVDQLTHLAIKRYVSPYDMALIHLSLDEQNRAFEWLEKAFEERAEWMIYLPVDPRFDKLRADPRFKSILRRAGFANSSRAAEEER